jgi:hypothetical protein
MVPDANVASRDSYYGRPILKRPTWSARDIGSYLFLGGLAGGSALLGAGADLTGRPALRRAGRLVAAGAISASAMALIDDLGRPERFLNMLRVAKPTSPMSVGSWLLAGFGPAAGLAAASEMGRALPGRLGRLATGMGRAAGLGSAVLGPAVATYTAVLLSDTAVPTWHEGYPQLPFLFAGSSAAAAGGVAAMLAPPAQAGPARRLAVAGAAVELGASELMARRLGLAAGTLHQGRAGNLNGAARALTGAGGVLTLLAGRRNRAAAAAGGALLAAGSACTRFALFEAGVASTEDPRYTVVPQRSRLQAPGPSAT